jgi:hypothetical protein
LQPLCSHFAVASQSLRNRFAVTFQSLRIFAIPPSTSKLLIFINFLASLLSLSLDRSSFGIVLLVCAKAPLFVPDTGCAKRIEIAGAVER